MLPNRENKARRSRYARCTRITTSTSRMLSASAVASRCRPHCAAACCRSCRPLWPFLEAWIHRCTRLPCCFTSDDSKMVFLRLSVRFSSDPLFASPRREPTWPTSVDKDVIYRCGQNSPKDFLRAAQDAASEVAAPAAPAATVAAVASAAAAAHALPTPDAALPAHPPPPPPA